MIEPLNQYLNVLRRNTALLPRLTKNLNVNAQPLKGAYDFEDIGIAKAMP